MSEDFVDRVLFRVLVAALLPNALVVGFYANDMADDRYPMWRLIVGPYWHFEVYLLCSSFVVAVGFFLWRSGILSAVGEVLLAIFELAFGLLMIWMNKKESKRQRREQEERKRAFLALPLDEQNRILMEQKALEEAREREVERQFEGLARYRREKELEAQKEAERQKAEKRAEEQRRWAIENSPDFQHRKALERFIGGRGR